MKIEFFSPLKVIGAIVRRATSRVSVPMVIVGVVATAPFNTSAEPITQERHEAATHHVKSAGVPHAPDRTIVVRSDMVRRSGGKVVAVASQLHRKHRYALAMVRSRLGRSDSIQKVAFSPPSSLGGHPFAGHDVLEARALRSNVAYMVDRNTGEVLFAKNSQAVVPIASVTKLMTAIVVLDSKASLSEAITVTDEDRDFEKNTGSRLSVGSVLSREDMLHIALMSSENRAAAALSRYYPGGRPGFIAAMNQKARSLGMEDTHFENPAGLSKLNISSARDLVKMVEAAYQQPLIRNFSTDPSYQVNIGKGIISYHNTNILLHDPDWNIGVQKTGFINESGICLVMQATIGKRPVVIVLLDSVGRHSDFADASRLRAMLKDKDSPPIGSTGRVAVAGIERMR